MSLDFRVKVGFLGNKKTKKLERSLGPVAVKVVIALWDYVTINHPDDGIIDDCDDKGLADILSFWKGSPSKLVEALIDSGFVERTDNGGFKIHDWAEHQPFNTTAPMRKEIAKKAANERWKKRAYAYADSNARSNADSNAERNAPLPTPYPTPSPTPKDKSNLTRAREDCGNVDNSSSAEKSALESKTELEVKDPEEAFRDWLTADKAWVETESRSFSVDIVNPGVEDEFHLMRNWLVKHPGKVPPNALAFRSFFTRWLVRESVKRRDKNRESNRGFVSIGDVSQQVLDDS